MTYQLKPDEILEAMQRVGHPRYEAHKRALEAAANLAAEDLADALEIGTGWGEFEGVAFAGLCVPFWPVEPDQEMPEALEGLDAHDEWGPI